MTRMLSLGSALLLVVALAGPARTQGPGVDLIPEDAAFGLVVKNLDDLRAKGDKLHKDLGVKDNALPRPTELFKQLFDLLIGSEKGIDFKGSAAIVIPNTAPLKLEGTAD